MDSGLPAVAGTSRTSIWAVGNPQGQRTQMNLRGLSYWTLPSQPVSRLGYSRLAKVRSQQLVPGGASISPTPQYASPLTTLSVTISCIVRSPEPTTRLSESADRSQSARCAPRWGAHAAATLKVLPPQIKKKQKQSAKLQEHSPRITFSRAFPHTGQKKRCRSRFVPCRDQPWFPCATLRIAINTLHCSVDAPS